ncbi:conjugal transfer protein (plasmid) [Stutzerimonas degradans]|nr:conjugal transfer protein [Stutzerimonas degradans]
MVKRTLAVAIALTVSVTAAAGDLGIKPLDVSTMDPALLEQARQAVSDAKDARNQIPQADTQWLEQLATQNPAPAELQQEEQAEGAEQPSKKHPLGEGVRTLIFVSWSLGATAIKDILSSYDGRPSTGIVFRGIPEGMKMIDAVSKMHMLTQETQSQVSVLLDPLAFQRHSIQTVPAIVLEGENDELLVKASGITSTRLVDQAITDPKKKGHDLGVYGPTSEIIEPDFLQVAKARIEALDTEAMKKRAIDRFWHTQAGTPLPPVTIPATRLVDPSVIIQDDIKDALGNVVQKAGRINPLEMMPFNQKLVVIDPTQPWQVRLAQREYQAHGQELFVTVMATQIPPSSGWDLFQSVEEAIDGPLYLLPGDMAQRFQILRAPSVVTAEKLMFVVREYARDEVEGNQ